MGRLAVLGCIATAACGRIDFDPLDDDDDDPVFSAEACLKAPNTGAGDLFGFSAALPIDGTTLAVGAYQEASAGIGGNQAAHRDRRRRGPRLPADGRRLGTRGVRQGRRAK